MLNFIQKFLSLLSRTERKNLYLLLPLLIGLACIEVLGIASILPFMAVVSDPDIIIGNRWLKSIYDYFGFKNQENFIFFLGAIMFVLLIIGNFSKGLNTWLRLKYDNNIYSAIACRLLGSYLNKPYEFFLSRNTSEMGKNVLSEVGNFVSGILSPFMEAVTGALISIFILALLMSVNAAVAVTIAVVLGGSYGVIYWMVRDRLKYIGKAQVEAATMKYKLSTEALAGIKDLKILGKEKIFLERFAIHAQHHAQQNVLAGVISQIPRYVLEVVAFGGILLIILIYLGTEKKINELIPLLALYAFAGYRLLPALQQLFFNISRISYYMAGLNILHQDLHDEFMSASKININSPRAQPLLFAKELILNNLSFYYPNTINPTIDCISFKIAANSSVGLVGPTGSGKTTIVDIILGLLIPNTGTMLVDGIKIQNSTLSSWQRQLGYVPQHIYLCDDTIYSNIALGVPEQEIDMTSVKHAARIANIHKFIENELANGYSTVVGERGVRLSGGQRQRIGIARALYHDPKLLIMDEATSALDGVTEEVVMDALRTLSGKKTIIIVAHRLSTVKDCDIIYLMDHGKIVNQGTYHELLKSSSWFQMSAGVKP